jgi:hypothetical protein
VGLGGTEEKRKMGKLESPKDLSGEKGILGTQYLSL